jgi:hypothetical protein
VFAMDNNNIRTMEFVGEDDWGNEVYKCIETGRLYKNGEIEGFTPKLYTCGNDFDGEMGYPIPKEWEVKFIERELQPTKEEKFNYMMLSRLQLDCNYYLGNGNRYAPHLWAGNEQGQIEEMKKIYNSFAEDKKPEWLTWEQILEYEKLMINNI